MGFAQRVKEKYAAYREEKARQKEIEKQAYTEAMARAQAQKKKGEQRKLEQQREQAKIRGTKRAYAKAYAPEIRRQRREKIIRYAKSPKMRQDIKKGVRSARSTALSLRSEIISTQRSMRTGLTGTTPRRRRRKPVRKRKRRTSREPRHLSELPSGWRR